MTLKPITKHLATILFVSTVFVLPIPSLAQVADTPTSTTTLNIPQVADNQIFDCSGSAQNSVGWEQARGVFVPVSENAVAHNTNVLVYKECVLDRIANKIKESMLAFMTKSTLNWVNNTSDGTPAFVTNLPNFRKGVSDKTINQFLTGKQTEVLPEKYRDDIRRIILKNYSILTKTPEALYTPTIPEDKQGAVNDLFEGKGTFKWDTFEIATQPQNNPTTQLLLATNQAIVNLKRDVADAVKEVDWGQGFKPQKKCEQIPAGNGTYKEICNIVTPSSSIKDIVNYTLLTGQRQVENADQMDKLVGSLMSNIHNRILTNTDGLRGITDSSYGQSYIDKVVQDAQAGAKITYTNVGLDFISKILESENAYSTIRNSTQDALNALITQLKNKETTCWDDLITRAKIDIIDEVEDQACNQQQSAQCSATGTATVKTATSTNSEYLVKITGRAGNNIKSYTLLQNNQNSKSVIQDNITPLMNLIRRDIDYSAQSLVILNNFRTMLESSNSLGNTRFVINEVQQLIREGKVHGDAEVANARNSHRDTLSFIENLYTETESTWDDTWCNPDNWRAQIKK